MIMNNGLIINPTPKSADSAERRVRMTLCATYIHSINILISMNAKIS